MFQTLQVKSLAAFIAVVIASLLTPARAAVLIPSQTLRAGTRINCVLDETIDSATARYGSDFKLRVVDPSHPALEGAKVHGFISSVSQPSGGNHARIRFLLTTIHLRNGTNKPIHAYVLNRNVIPYNPAAVRMQLPPNLPNGTVTPGPVAFQINFGNGPPSIGNRPNVAVGGTIYASNAHQRIVLARGTPITIELQSPLTIP